VALHLAIYRGAESAVAAIAARQVCVGRSLVDPYWIKTEEVRLAIIPRPRGQDWLPDDISLLWRAGIDIVVSALTAAENEELGLVEESRCCQSRGIEFLSFPIEDRSVPNSSAEFT
jgi:hypothetical protein